MRAAVLYSPQTPFEIEELVVEAPRQGEVLVEMAASGVCGSDEHVVSGATRHALPVVLGHEGAGVVLQVGPGVERISPGDHVVLSWVPICGECFYCLRGLPAHCERTLDWAWAGTQADGSPRLSLQNGEPVYQLSAISTFAERSVVPAMSCIPVRKDAPLTSAALVGCGVTTGFGAVVNTAHVQPGDTVAVFGCGGVGLNVIQSARAAGARLIIAVDVLPAKLALAETMGATHLANAGEIEPVAFIRQHTQGRGVDHAFEVIGRPEVMRQAYEATRACGNTVLDPNG
jgi:S-(hydroxymethyl)glutathione dehydrogenase/alcohol dehydrogenase